MCDANCWLQRMKNPAQLARFVKAAAGHVVRGLPMADDKPARLAICATCDKFRAGRCELCGCNLEWKASWADQHCPIGKW